MASSELLDLIYHGHEERNLEYKPSLQWKDTHTQAKITKAILAMSNVRDGGTIILGVEKSGADPIGMKSADAATFNLDAVLPVVNEYADPFVEITITHATDNDKEFVVIQVREFAEIPVICKKDGKLENIRKGAIYTRSNRIPESTEVRSQTEMREILDLATIKGVRRRLAELQRMGIRFQVSFEEHDVDRQAFDDQLRGL